MKKLREKCGIPKHLTPHSMRRTFATKLSKEGANLLTIKNAMGHSNIKTTLNYI